MLDHWLDRSWNNVCCCGLHAIGRMWLHWRGCTRMLTGLETLDYKERWDGVALFSWRKRGWGVTILRFIKSQVALMKWTATVFNHSHPFSMADLLNEPTPNQTWCSTAPPQWKLQTLNETRNSQVFCLKPGNSTACWIRPGKTQHTELNQELRWTQNQSRERHTHLIISVNSTQNEWNQHTDSNQWALQNIDSNQQRPQNLNETREVQSSLNASRTYQTQLVNREHPTCWINQYTETKHGPAEKIDQSKE